MSAPPKQGPVRGLIFDFDGVILHSEPAHLEAWRETAAHHEVPLPEDFAHHSVGRKDRLIAEDLERHSQGRIRREVLLSRKRVFHERIVAGGPVLIPGICDALPVLAARWPLAIATSSNPPPVEEVLQATGMGKHFRVICTFDDVAHPKPAPDLYLLAAQRLGFAPEECVAFEDSTIGIAAARAAGMPVVGVSSSFPAERLTGTQHTIPDFTDLPALIAWLERH